MKNSCLVSTAYWGPVQYFAKFVEYEQVLIEQWETYPKQTYRNRCVLYGPNCIQSLQVPVEKGRVNQLVKDIRIAYNSLWQKNHFATIESLYHSSPFYDYYIDDIELFYRNKYNYLIEYNNSITELCLKWLKLPAKLNFTTDFEKQPTLPDFRNTITPKHSIPDPNFVAAHYQQVFAERLGFAPNLSILDLVMNCGPESAQIIKASIIP